MTKVFIIGEAGINHNGKVHKAKKLINIAKKAGVDAIKFQLFNSDYFVNKSKLPKYHKIFKKLEFSEKQWKKILNHAKKRKLKLFFSVFDIPSLETVQKFKLKLVKIPSGEINNHLLLREINKRKLDVILSTGMATVKEISSSLKILKNCKKKILHCVSEYPAKIDKLNLNFIKKLKKSFNLETGFSDHTIGFLESCVAVAVGATIIEKHFTYDKNQKFGDHKMSLNPIELINFVEKIRNTEIILGNSKKIVFKEEINLSKIARKGVYLKSDIKKGKILNLKDIIFLRPQNSKSLFYYKKIIGRKAKKNLVALQSLNSNDFLK